MKTVCIHRHPDCARCARYARMHRRLDWLDRVDDSTRSPFERPMRIGEVVVGDQRFQQAMLRVDRLTRG